MNTHDPNSQALSAGQAPAGDGLPLVPRRQRGTLRLSASEIYFEVTGSGPALIFAHGLGGNHISWWQQVAHFCDRYTCVTFSHRGFPPSVNLAGTSGHVEFASDLAALVEHLELTDVYLVSQSMGGWTCLTYALQERRRVRGLVLSSTTGTVDFEAIQHPEIERLPQWKEWSQSVRTDLTERGLLASTGARMAREQPSRYFLYQELYDLAAASYKDTVRKQIRASRHLAPEVLKSIGFPTLFIVGEEDLLFPPMAARAAASLIPGAMVVEVPEAGHSVYFERPEQYNAALDAFLAVHTGIQSKPADGA
jgi:3-oxoadipate enol-lactonase